MHRLWDHVHIVVRCAVRGPHIPGRAKYLVRVTNIYDVLSLLMPCRDCVRIKQMVSTLYVTFPIARTLLIPLAGTAL